MPTHRSFREQSLHYFVRKAEGRPDGPIDHRAAWRGEELAAHPERWRFELTARQLAEIEAAARHLLDAGVPMQDVTAERFPLPTLGDAIAAWRNELADGLGVLCLRGLPVCEWGDAVAAYAYWGLGHHVGVPGAQNPADELLGHVTDYGESARDPMVRKYRTASEIAFHCDAADVVGLLCLRAAKHGGQSRIASSVTVFNEIARRRPDLVPELFEPFAVDRRNEQGEGERPVFDLTPCAWDGERLRTFWHSDYMRSAARHEEVALSPRRLELMDLYDAIAASEGVHLDMWLEPGDLQLISNHTVVHARTGYVDHDDPAERRHLLRLWLSLD